MSGAATLALAIPGACQSDAGARQHARCYAAGRAGRGPTHDQGNASRNCADCATDERHLSPVDAVATATDNTSITTASVDPNADLDRADQAQPEHEHRVEPRASEWVAVGGGAGHVGAVVVGDVVSGVSLTLSSERPRLRRR